MRSVHESGYEVDDDRARLDLRLVHEWLSEEAYWSLGRSYEIVRESVAHSLAFGLYAPDGSQCGFARAVTDLATFTWLCDVFVEADHRGHGLGGFLVETALSHPSVRRTRVVLATRPGRTLYRRLGFSPLARPERWLERRDKESL